MSGVLSKLLVSVLGINKKPSFKQRLKNFGERFSRNLRCLFILGRKSQSFREQLSESHVQCTQVASQKPHSTIEDINLLEAWIPCTVSDTFASEVLEYYEHILWTIKKDLTQNYGIHNYDKEASDFQFTQKGNTDAHKVPTLNCKEPAVGLVAMLSAYGFDSPSDQCTNATRVSPLRSDQLEENLNKVAASSNTYIQNNIHRYTTTRTPTRRCRARAWL